MAMTQEINGYQVHPIAALFPMLSAEDMQELADDINDRGLLHPIVLDKDGQILDGRNRLQACAWVGIDPTFTTYDGEDAAGYALSSNIARRHLNKGQQAMIRIKAGGSVSEPHARSLQVSKTRLSQAHLVLDYAPDLVDEVIAGMRRLDNAYDIARQRKADEEARERRLAELREAYADLATRLEDDEIEMADALAEMAERERQAEQARVEREAQVRDTSTGLAMAVRWLAENLMTPESRQSVRALFDRRFITINYRLSLGTLDQALANFTQFVAEWNDDDDS